MSRNKQKRFQANDEAWNVIQPDDDRFEVIKGNWNKDFFKGDKPITLELGCGRGEYTIGLAQKFPDRHFIGVDIKGSRIWKGSQYALKEGLTNCGFLRTRIMYLEKVFDEQEVDEIWITFPDPRPKDVDERKRLMSPGFLDLYRKSLKKDGLVHLKTDNHPLYLYCLEVIDDQKLEIVEQTDDLYSSDLLEDHHGIQTNFEKKFLAQGMKINYVRFRL